MKKPSFAVLVSILCFAILAVMAPSAQAKRTVDNSAPQEVVEGMSTKLVRGVANIATGWVELPKQIVITFQEEGAVKGIFVGPLKGIGMTVVRTLSGVGEVATFYAPFPGFYEPFFSPEYVWEPENSPYTPQGEDSK